MFGTIQDLAAIFPKAFQKKNRPQWASASDGTGAHLESLHTLDRSGLRFSDSSGSPRVAFFHRIFPSDKPLLVSELHNHMWPIRVHLLSGEYEMMTARLLVDEGRAVDISRRVIPEGGTYEMLKQSDLHTIQVRNRCAYTVMMIGGPLDAGSWPALQIHGERIILLSQEQLDAFLDDFYAVFRQNIHRFNP